VCFSALSWMRRSSISCSSVSCHQIIHSQLLQQSHLQSAFTQDETGFSLLFIFDVSAAADRQDWVIVPTVRPLSPASVMTPTTNFSSGSPATVSTYYIGCCHLNESSTTVYASAATTTSCPSQLLCLKTKTSSLECCINLEIDCHNTPLTFISQCKLDSVLSF